MLARWRPCSTTSGELYRRYCANKKENAGRVANYLRTMGTIWRALSRPEIMMMGQIAYLDAYAPHPRARPAVRPGAPRGASSCVDGPHTATVLIQAERQDIVLTSCGRHGVAHQRHPCARSPPLGHTTRRRTGAPPPARVPQTRLGAPLMPP